MGAGYGMIAAMNERDVLELLSTAGIAYQRYDHPAVFTSAASAACLADAPGVEGKNLFLCDKRGRRFYLLMTLEEKRVDLKSWGEQEGLGKLRFAAPEHLEELLGVSRGAVGPLALINDWQHRIEVYADRELWCQPVVRCHPLVNTASLIIATRDMQRFFELTGHTFRLVDVSSMNQSSL